MIKKTFIAVVAAGTLALGLSAAATPAAAKHRSGHVTLCIGSCYGGPFFGHGRWQYDRHCHWIKVKRHGGWIKVRDCHRHRHGPGHHY